MGCFKHPAWHRGSSGSAPAGMLLFDFGGFAACADQAIVVKEFLAGFDITQGFLKPLPADLSFVTRPVLCPYFALQDFAGAGFGQFAHKVH